MPLKGRFHHGTVLLYFYQQYGNFITASAYNYQDGCRVRKIYESSGSLIADWQAFSGKKKGYPEEDSPAKLCL